MVKLINFFENTQFNLLRNEMRASAAKNFKSNIEIQFLDEESIRRLGREGIDVDFDEIKPQKDKTLGYNGQRVLIYIRDVSQYRGNFNLPRFHISYCNTLEEMRKGGRWGRYVVANRTDGDFQVRVNNGEYQSKKLDVCQCCLETLSWSDFSRHTMKSKRRNIVMEFSIAEFFNKYPKSLFSVTPTYTSDTAPVNEYTSDWHTVSANLKKMRGYQCEANGCHIKLSGTNQKYLHVHHLNGLKNDNSKSNLEVLCIRCHAEEPYHSNVKTDMNYKEFMRIFHTIDEPEQKP